MAIGIIKSLQMLPPIVHNNLHLVHDTEPALLLPSLTALHPLLDPLAHLPLLKPGRSQPPCKPVPPQSEIYFGKRQPTAAVVVVDSVTMHRVVSLPAVADTHGWVDKHPPSARGRVVCVDEAALGGFKVGHGKIVRDAAKFEAADARKRRRRHGDCFRSRSLVWVAGIDLKEGKTYLCRSSSLILGQAGR